MNTIGVVVTSTAPISAGPGDTSRLKISQVNMPATAVEPTSITA